LQVESQLAEQNPHPLQTTEETKMEKTFDGIDE
jgi:hypothetical protein